MDKNSKIYIAGHSGLVGSAIVRRLRQDGYSNLITATRAEVDLISQASVDDFFKEEKPEYVFFAAAKVGGIHANSAYPAEFIYDNLQIQTNVIHSAWKHRVNKLVYLGSSCIYPKFAPQPMKEEYLLTGELETTNEWYAIAKIAGIKMCQAYRKQYGFNAISLMPTNLYGPVDNFDLETSHVLPALIRKVHEAKTNGKESVTIWGSGSPKREFLHVDDLAEACLFLINDYDESEIVNVGTGKDISIKKLAELIKGIVGFDGVLEFDQSKPDGSPQKLLDTSKINALGWLPGISLEDGISSTYQWYCKETA
jgi:GDP-L-fucose synthase